MNRIAVGNLLMSFILTMLGVYDVRHELIGYGIVELWIGGGCFVAALHVASRKKHPVPVKSNATD